MFKLCFYTEQEYLDDNFSVCKNSGSVEINSELNIELDARDVFGKTLEFTSFEDLANIVGVDNLEDLRNFADDDYFVIEEMDIVEVSDMYDLTYNEDQDEFNVGCVTLDREKAEEVRDFLTEKLG